MKKFLLVGSLALFLTACNDGSSEQTQSTATQKTASVVTSMQSSVAIPDVSKEPLPEWIKQANKVTAPIGDTVIDGKSFTATNYCKPHACGNNFMITLSNQDKKDVSLVVSVKDTDGAITEPSKYAIYWFIGNPDQSMKEALVKTLQQNPNWK
ncbi:lysozyme inhibitor [Photobacterium damselae]